MSKKSSPKTSGRKKRSISSRPMRKANNARSLRAKYSTICALLAHSTDTQSSRLKSSKSSTRRPSPFCWNIRAENSSSRCALFSRPATTCERISWLRWCSSSSTRSGRTLAWRRNRTSISTWSSRLVLTLVSLDMTIILFSGFIAV